MDVTPPGERLGPWLARALAAKACRIERWAKLGGGAIQENWAIDVTIEGGPRAGALALVLRTDAPSGVAASHSRVHEYALLAAAHGAGVTVPEPLAVCVDPGVIGKPFYVMRRAEGTAAGHILTRDDKWHGDRIALVARLGEELARIHSIRPPRDDLSFLEIPSQPPAEAAIAEYRAALDGYDQPRPALEWGLAWLAANAPPTRELVLCHRDYRTGNYMADAIGLTAILDWEFAGWGDPYEDIAWFCAKCWRFGVNAREAGGMADRETFFRGYERVAGRSIDRTAVYYWEVMAHARWTTIALMQGWRHVSGAERSLDLALTGRRVAELEYELLRMTAPAPRAREA
ncbi:MAG TPA: phosphotransferase family protein [Alphaproteobacteria bacterium]|nr:phosphotransferase family protein [Alphaproteobacteria bacterium]